MSFYIFLQMKGMLLHYKHIPELGALTWQDTSLYIGSNNVASDVKVDPDKFTLWKK